MKKAILFLKVCILFGCCQISYGQSPSDTSKWIRKSSLVGLPVAFYTPETRFGGGVAGLFTFRFRHETDSSRPSQLQLIAAYTAEKQLLIYFPFQIYWKNEDHFAYGELGYYQYVYYYFGNGNSTLIANEESYEATFPRVRLNWLRKIADQDYLGLRYWFDAYKISNQQEGGLLLENDIVGNQGGNISALGVIYNRDTRDQLFYPTRGTWLDVGLVANQTWLGSDFNYLRFTADFSKYFSTKSNQILAVNVFSEMLWGEVPFQQLAFIGGSKKMRGYFEGRFRDQTLWMLQSEFRQPIAPWLKLVFFGGVGSVAPKVEDLAKARAHVSFGSGLRLRISKVDNIHVRIDAGFDTDFNFLPYLTIGEAF